MPLPHPSEKEQPDRQKLIYNSRVSFSLREKVKSHWREVERKSRTAERQRAEYVFLSSPTTISLSPAFLPSTSGSDFYHWMARWTHKPFSLPEQWNTQMNSANVVWLVIYSWSPLRTHWPGCIHTYSIYSDKHTPSRLTPLILLPRLLGDHCSPCCSAHRVCFWCVLYVLCRADEPKQAAVPGSGFQTHFQGTWLHTCLCRFWQTDDWRTKLSSETHTKPNTKECSSFHTHSSSHTLKVPQVPLCLLSALTLYSQKICLCF